MSDICFLMSTMHMFTLSNSARHVLTSHVQRMYADDAKCWWQPGLALHCCIP